MPQHIYLLDSGAQLGSLEAVDYLSEADLQKLICEHPELLDGDLIDAGAPRKWLLLRREMPVSNDESGSQWSLDHLLIDQDAIPTLVEVKRASDTRTRREVVAQMLDYAANAVKFWPVRRLRETFEERCEHDGLEPDQHVRDRLGDLDIEQFWQHMEANLIEGRIRLLFLADRIPPELRRIIEFLNEQMDPAEVLGLEIQQFRDGSLRTLVPRVVGHTSEAERRKSTGGSRTSQWNEETFFAQLAETNAPDIVAVCRDVYSWATNRFTRIAFGTGKRASFVPILIHQKAWHQAFAIASGNSPDSAYCEMYFYWYAYKKPFDDEGKRREMLNKLNAIGGISLPPDSVNRRPNFPLSALVRPDRLKQFLEVMEWYLQQIEAVHESLT